MSTLKDNINIIKHLSFIRLWNLFLLKLSFYLSRITKKALVFGKPYSVSIEPTTACNLGCPECPSGLKQFSRPTGKLDVETNAKILQQVGSQLFYINYYFQGEPFLNPEFLEFVKEAKKHRIYTATSTNAHFISENKAKEIVQSGLDRLIISIDGMTQKTYESYRVHGSLEKVIAGTKELIKAKQNLKSQTPHLIFQFLIVKPNEHEVQEVFALANKIGVNEVRLKTAQVYEYIHGNPLIPENENYSRYLKQKDGTFKLKAGIGNHCWRMWSSCVFTWDAKIVPCCFDKDARFQLGSILDNLTNFNEIWRSKPYTQFREQILQDRTQIEICKNCSEGSKVWI